MALLYFALQCIPTTTTTATPTITTPTSHHATQRMALHIQVLAAHLRATPFCSTSTARKLAGSFPALNCFRSLVNPQRVDYGRTPSCCHNWPTGCCGGTWPVGATSLLACGSNPSKQATDADAAGHSRSTVASSVPTGCTASGHCNSSRRSGCGKGRHSWLGACNRVTDDDRKTEENTAGRRTHVW